MPQSCFDEQASRSQGAYAFVPMFIVLLGRRVRLLAWPCKSFASVFRVVRHVPSRPSSLLIFVDRGVFLDGPLELLLRTWLFCTRPPDLHHSSRKDLSCRVKVVFSRRHSGIKPVGVVAIIPGLKSVDDGRTELRNFGGSELGGFDSVQGTCVDLGRNSFDFCLRAGGTEA